MLADNREDRGHAVVPGKQIYLVGKRGGKAAKAASKVGSDETHESFFAMEPPALLALQHMLEANEDTNVVHVIGANDDPDLLVVEMFSEHAEQLKGERPDLIVEEDASLHTLTPG